LHTRSRVRACRRIHRGARQFSSARRDNKSITSCHTWRLTQRWRNRVHFTWSRHRESAGSIWSHDRYARSPCISAFGVFVESLAFRERNPINRAAIKVIARLIMRALRKQEQDSRVIGAIWLIKKFCRLRERKERCSQRIYLEYDSET